MIATDPLSLVFIFCFLLGFGFFLVAGLMGHGHGDGGHIHAHAHLDVGGLHHAAIDTGGHVGHAGHAGHNAGHTPGAHSGSSNAGDQQAGHHSDFSLAAYLNPTSIALFLLGFGFFGYVFHNLTPGLASFSLLLAFVCGIVLAAALLFALSRLFANVESATEQDVVDRTGMLGKVSITIPEKGLGEIIYTSPGGLRKSIPARGLNGQRLERDEEVVVVNYQQGVAEVDTWEHFMHGEIHDLASNTPEDLAQLHVLLNQSGSGELEMLMQQEKPME